MYVSNSAKIVTITALNLSRPGPWSLVFVCAKHDYVFAYILRCHFENYEFFVIMRFGVFKL